MTSDRRRFLATTAASAAAVGLPRALRADLGLRGGVVRPYLDLALKTAAWIDRSGQEVGTGLQYPADPLKPDSVGLDLYNGMPGIVAFHAALSVATNDVAWLRTAKRGAEYLMERMDGGTDQIGAGLYTGLAGLGYAFRCVEWAGGGDRYGAADERAAQMLVRTARRVGDGVEWSDSNDIISGTAGIGLYLLAAGRQNSALVELAARAGRRLLATGEPAEGGRMWFPAASLRRNYPNFSHGTSGVAYFLATLHQVTGERAFLEGALEGARYLDRVATRRDGATTIFHQSGGGEQRFYLSWCHGPVGTARLFYRLHQITGQAVWRDWVDSLTRGVFESGAPERRTEGYWNNISQCCGNVGIGQYCIDLARYHRTPTAAAIQARIVADTTRRGTEDERGLRWVQAENRTQPDNVVAQTGFMQGAAGVGTFFLQLDALERGAPWLFPLPDTPFAG
ncbi:MAG: lanthionine synthetase LanC family protein [Gemmatimonadales bacterium]|nr:lanthionine synthetase LanC family protein [Gemmatimonadales bacterium]